MGLETSLGLLEVNDPDSLANFTADGVLLSSLACREDGDIKEDTPYEDMSSDTVMVDGSDYDSNVLSLQALI